MVTQQIWASYCCVLRPLQRQGGCAAVVSRSPARLHNRPTQNANLILRTFDDHLIWMHRCCILQVQAHPLTSALFGLGDAKLGNSHGATHQSAGASREIF